MQRIEDYKDSVSREELLGIGDEAASELQTGTSGQLVLTEVMIRETVDQRIIDRLKLPSYRKWRSKILPLRKAQRAPTRWGLNATDPVSLVLPRIEPGDRALVVGGGSEPAIYLLAAHDVVLQCLVGDTSAATKIEGTLASESLSGQCDVFVVSLGLWMPPEATGPYHLVVVDAAAVAHLPRDRQRALIHHAQHRTAPEGLHAVVSSDAEVAPEACLVHYPEWQRYPVPKTSDPSEPSRGLRGVLLSGPPIPPATTLTSLR
jgi:hypothetical protein